MNNKAVMPNFFSTTLSTNRKGITPVVATVLLMTITVAATASAFTFMTGVQGDFMDSVEDRQQDRQEEAQSDLNIETAYNSTDGYIILSVRNTGSITLGVEEDDGRKLWNLFIDGRPLDGGTGWKYRTDPQDRPGESLEPQSSININTTEKFPADDSDKQIMITGPNSVSDSKVCYNSGSASC